MNSNYATGKQAGEEAALALLRNADDIIDELQLNEEINNLIESLSEQPLTYANGFMAGFFDAFYQYN